MAIVGPQLGPRAVCLASALVGCAFVLALWPPCAWRVLYPSLILEFPAFFLNVFRGSCPAVRSQVFGARW